MSKLRDLAGTRHAPLKGNIFVRDLAGAGVHGFSLPIGILARRFGAITRAKQYEVAGHYLRAVLLFSALAIFPARGLQSALDVNLGARADIFPHDLGKALPRQNVVPLRAGPATLLICP